MIFPILYHVIEVVLYVLNPILSKMFFEIMTGLSFKADFNKYYWILIFLAWSFARDIILPESINRLAVKLELI